MAKTFVGIGFGPIQSGLFLLEASKSKNFERLVVAEVTPEVVAAVRRNRGSYDINVAETDAIQSQQITGMEIYNPLDVDDQEQLVRAIASADEIATALPSVDVFNRGSPSPVELLARGLRRKLANDVLPNMVVYAAENHNHAAEQLRAAVATLLDPTESMRLDDRVQFVNTVIGKMSGVVTDPLQIRNDSLVPLVEGLSQAVLVEQFNSILIGKITLADFERSLAFQEKSDLRPFEEAKLYGHNAAHALIGYLANHQRLKFVHEVDPNGLLKFVEEAFLEESGGALCRRHADVDSLFAPAAWAAYVCDLLKRMVNPYLRDRVDRVIRDPWRKLGCDDRLIGTMRIALKYGVDPRRYALGAAAAVELLIQEFPGHTVTSILDSAWADVALSGSERTSIILKVEQAREILRSSAFA